MSNRNMSDTKSKKILVVYDEVDILELLKYNLKKEGYTVKAVANRIGISEKHINRIFERFYRIDKSRSREKGGTGLGLSIVKHILEAHHSQIMVTSTQNSGSTFSFKLSKGQSYSWTKGINYNLENS